MMITEKNVIRRRHLVLFAADFFVDIDQLVAGASRTINLVKARHYKWRVCSATGFEEEYI